MNEYLADSHRATGDRSEYTYEIEVTNGDDSAQFKGTVQLRLWREKNIFTHPDLPGHTWGYLIRTCHQDESSGQRVSEPFTGRPPFAVTGIGPDDRHPAGDFRPDELAAGLLAHFADWRNPTDPLTKDQQEWFRQFGPALLAAMPNGDTAEEWIHNHRTSQG